MTAPRVLIIGNNMTILKELKATLLKEDYEVIAEADGLQGVKIAQTTKPDVVIVSTALQSLSGFEVCRILRQEIVVPILMVSSELDEIDTILGLNVGADDYITNPFSVKEIVARIRAKLRRVDMLKLAAASGRNISSLIRCGDIEIDLERHLVLHRGSVINLSPNEFRLLLFFVNNAGKTFSRDQLYTELGGRSEKGSLRTVYTRIHWLRQKIEDNPVHPRYLFTVRGAGYRFGKPSDGLPNARNDRNDCGAIQRSTVINK